MSFFDDGNFSAEDAAVFGGIAGFAEESMREENIDPDEYDPIDDQKEKDEIDNYVNNNVPLRLLRNENPNLFNYVLKLAREHQLKWAEERRIREEVSDELEAIADCESELANLEKKNED